jgi:hypothetical protein
VYGTFAGDVPALPAVLLTLAGDIPPQPGNMATTETAIEGTLVLTGIA